MAENNFPSQGSTDPQVPQNMVPEAPPAPPVSRAEDVPPPPPSAESQVGIRTMNEDVSAMRSSGGMTAEPKTFRPKDLLNNEPFFDPAQSAPSVDEAKRHHNKLVLISVIAVLGVIVLGSGTYLLFFNKPATVVPPPVPPVEPVTPPPPPEPPAPPAVPPFQHSTLFPASANIPAVPLALAAVTLDDFRASLRAAAQGETKLPVLKEFTVSGPEGQLDAFRFFSLFIPEFAALNQTDFLAFPMDRDYTAFFYKDANGTWPGYVVSIPSGDASVFTAQVEKQPLVFYLDDPGAPKAAEFKDGAKISANTQSVRYLPYSKTGASFNIATVKVAEKTYVLISTSFNGIKAAVKALGF